MIEKKLAAVFLTLLAFSLLLVMALAIHSNNEDKHGTCGSYDAIADVRTEIANTGLDIDRTEAHLEALQIVVYDRLRRIESALRTAEQ